MIMLWMKLIRVNVIVLNWWDQARRQMSKDLWILIDQFKTHSMYICILVYGTHAVLNTFHKSSRRYQNIPSSKESLG